MVWCGARRPRAARRGLRDLRVRQSAGGRGDLAAVPVFRQSVSQKGTAEDAEIAETDTGKLLSASCASSAVRFCRASTVIQVSDLRKSYGTLRAVDGISFAVPQGETFGLLGPN